jgi:acid phosphatase type 7
MKNHLIKSLAVEALLFAAPQLFAQSQPVELQAKVSVPFRFVAYGDTRFTNPNDTKASNPQVRQALVQAIDAVRPAFVSIGGDIAYNGNDPNDWKTWDEETSAWRQHNVAVYPALGNHDLHGDLKVALRNYFQRFPDLHESRYYSVRAANTLLLVLDSSLDEVSGPQGEWLAGKLDHIPVDVEFIFLVMHHPPYTSSSDSKMFGGGHSARSTEQELAKMLEARQQRTGASIVVIAGHVHNYERHEHGGVIYIVTGGGGAHAYPIERAPGDLYRDNRINYHYLLAEVDRGKLKITMNRLELKDGKAAWTQPDSVTLTAPAAAKTKAAAR